MPDTRPDHRSNDVKAAERIAAARAARPAVDHNGVPVGPASVFRYDASGLFLGVEPVTDTTQ